MICTEEILMKMHSYSCEKAVEATMVEESKEHEELKPTM